MDLSIFCDILSTMGPYSSYSRQPDYRIAIPLSFLQISNLYTITRGFDEYPNEQIRMYSV